CVPDFADAVAIEFQNLSVDLPERAALGDIERAAAIVHQMIGNAESEAGRAARKVAQRSPCDVETPDALFLEIADRKQIAIGANGYSQDKAPGVGNLLHL